MKLATFEPVEQYMCVERVGALLDDKRLVDLNFAYALYLGREKNEPKPYELASVFLPPTMIGILGSWEPSFEAARQTVLYIKSMVDSASKPVGLCGEKLIYDISDVRIKAPIPRPGKILAAGMNYAKHVEEGGRAIGVKREVPPFPRGFVKLSSIVIGPEETIVKSKFTNLLSYELELAVVIGKKGKYISKDDAYDYVAGYTMANDISARDIQREESKYGNHMMGKNLDTQAPMGPYLVTKDEVEDPQDLNLELRVNGVVRQDFNTSDMVHDIPTILERWSWTTLEPGDMIWTGTGEGTPGVDPKDFLHDGDVVEGRIEGFGILRNPVVAE
jgi:2-keto-4-pentenoate hydratase/2-oxohepta-3-ene-1,7-dioic acid hydratase in catechol pathway